MEFPKIILLKKLKHLSKNKIIIMVTHNVKLCKNADKIFLMENGMIRKIGKYQELIKDELFKKLLNEK